MTVSLDADGTGRRGQVGVTNRQMKRVRTGGARVASVSVALLSLVLVLSPLLAPRASAYIPCDGSATYTGIVRDQDQLGLPGVVVYLYTAYPYNGRSATAVTNAYGAWSATVDNGDCRYNAAFYWKSKTDGPHLMTATEILPGQTYTVRVWREAQIVALNYEFPNDPSVAISYTLTTNLQVSVDASVSGGMQVGFLGFNAAGKVGATLTMESSYSSSGSSPWYDFYTTGMTHKIIDSAGRTLIYVEQYSSSWFSSDEAVEYLTITDAINRDTDAGINPYVQIARNHVATYTWTLATTVTMDLEVSVEAFGVKLTTHMGVASGTSQSVSATITNDTNHARCYVQYQQGLEIHLWLYLEGRCPGVKGKGK